MLIITQQTVQIDDVTDISVTPIEQETTGDNLYVREFRIYGTPPEGANTPPQVFVLRLKAAEASKLRYSVPASEM